MDHACQIDSARQQVFEAARQLGVSEEEAAHPLETILLDDGFYVGRRFRWETLSAIWFHDEGTVEFYDETDALVQAIHLKTDHRRQDAA